MNLDNDLRRALRRESPAPGFAGRVLERIVEDGRSRPSRQAGLPAFQWWRAAAASVMLAAVLGGYAVHEVAERRRGERARQEVLRAMSIASEKVRIAQQEVREIGSH